MRVIVRRWTAFPTTAHYVTIEGDKNLWIDCTDRPAPTVMAHKEHTFALQLDDGTLITPPMASWDPECAA